MNTLFDTKALDLDWHKLATTDVVTGISNRLAAELIMKQPESASGVLFVLDLNKFKAINDTAGHEVGDRILTVIAQSLRHERANDFVARWGGDEYVLIVDCQLIEAPGIYHRLKAAVLSTSLDEFLPIEMAGRRCGVSIGYAEMNDPEAFNKADAQMYQDKKVLI